MLQTEQISKTDQIDAERIYLFGSYRPKIWLRRCRPELRPMVREYILNRGTEAEAVSLKNLQARL